MGKYWHYIIGGILFLANDPEFFGRGVISRTGQLGPKRALHPRRMDAITCTRMLELWGPLTQKD